MEQALQALIERVHKAQSTPGVIVAVEAPLIDTRVRLATGVFSRQSGRPLLPSDGFRIASMSKTFTGTLIMRRVESGDINLDEPVRSRLELPLLPVAPGYSQDDITVRMLLNHTAGLWDFAQSREWARHINQNPGRYRPPAEILDWALAHGEPVGPPGAQYHYSDTGYVILGRLLEAVTGHTWGDLVRREILTPLGMTETWLEGYESPRSTLSHPYVNDYDGLEIHGSVDWAAGGHVSTTADLCLFVRALFHGRLFRDLGTLDAAIRGADTGDGGAYGAGVRARSVGDVALWGHNGFWGSFMTYLPSLRVAMAGTLNRVGAGTPDLIDDMIGIIREAHQAG